MDTTDGPYYTKLYATALAARVTVYYIERLGTPGSVIFRFPREGDGRVHCLLDMDGIKATGWANGYGYDMRGAAFESAATAGGITQFQDIGGHSVVTALVDAGYTVHRLLGA